MSSISVTCPQAIRITKRKARNRQRWRTEKWKQQVQEHIIGKQCECHRYFGPNIKPCGKPANTPHHESGRMYEDDEKYMDPEYWVPLNSLCHHNLHKGFIRCPECSGWMITERSKCSRCSGWNESKRKKPRKRITHSCANLIGKQRCRRKGKDGQSRLFICPHSSNKARDDCNYFIKREVKK